MDAPRRSGAASDAAAEAGRTRWGAAAVAAVAVLVHANAWSGRFVFDDLKLIVNNEFLRRSATVPELLLSDLWAAIGLETGYYRPLAALSYRGIYAGFDGRPEAFHVASILLHALAAALVFLIARDWLERAGGGPGFAAMRAALAAGLLFAVHPVHVEAVAWVSGMMDVGATAFALLFLHLHGRSARAASSLALLAALLFKESAAAAVPLAVAFDLLVVGIWPRSVRAVLERFGGILAASVVYLGLRFAALGYLGAPSGAGEPGVLGTLTLVAAYAQKLVLPYPLSAVTDLRIPDAPIGLAAVRVGLLLSALAAGLVAAIRARGLPLAAVLVTTLPLIPALRVAPADPALQLAFAERYLYFPSVGFCLLAALVVARAGDGRGSGRAVTAAAALVVVSFAALTWQRNRVWHDEASLWSDTARKAPNVARVRVSFGLALDRQGRSDLAREEFEAARKLQPGLAREYVRSGVAAARRGQALSGILDLQIALRLDPDDVDANFNLAVAYESGGWTEQAAASYRHVLAVAPAHVGAHNNLAVLLAESGRMQEAIPHFEAVLRASPEDPEARRNLERARGAP